MRDVDYMLSVQDNNECAVVKTIGRIKEVQNERKGLEFEESYRATGTRSERHTHYPVPSEQKSLA